MTLKKLQMFSAFCVVAVVVPTAVPSCTTTERVTSGLSSPLYVTHAPGDANHIYIVEQGGKIKVMDLDTNNTTVFLDITTQVQSGGEQGLLGLAFSPDYETDDSFYVYYTRKPDFAQQVAEYKVSANPLVANPGSARPILAMSDPASNHNGGWMEFGVDGYLYISTGDGGGSNDEGTGHTAGTGNAQDITDNLLGKLLRINPFGDDFPGDANRNYAIPPSNPFVGVTGDDEIWAYGLRNPWRCSFDRQTNDLWIGDVGQGAREEIDFQPASSDGGENYGWRLREGSIQTPGSVGGPAPAGAIEPIYDYSHGAGQFQGNSVTGGYVYRGPIADLQGKYFFGDYVTQKVWSVTRDGATFTDLTDWTAQFAPNQGSIDGISSFGEDAQGNLYIVDLDGEIFRVVQTGPFRAAAKSVSSAVTKTMQGGAGRK
jgi:glucose/arabinose dehydrogenase